MKTVAFEACGAKVTGYLQEDHDRLVAHKIRPALIVCPGGGYQFVCAREADPPALAYSAIGYQVFILDYAVLSCAGAYRPLRQLAETVAAVRRRAGEWHIDPEKIAVMGFSAGGHLSASLGALWNDEALSLPEGCRPDALLLCYPVISLLEKTHRDTSDTVSGGDEAVREKLSVERHVTAAFPPSFIWHTVDDASVPVENSLALVSALQRSGVAYECHLFAHGEHGLSICTQEVERPNRECATWVELSKTWLNNQFSYTV